MSSINLVRTTREALLRPLQVVSNIVNRRIISSEIVRFIPLEGQGARRKEPARRPKARRTHAVASTGITGDQAGGGTSSSEGGGSGGDGGDGGDGDSDGPRRCSRASASPSSPSLRAVRRKFDSYHCQNRSHTHALLTLVVLAILVFTMAFFLVERDHPWLAAEVMTALGGLPRLARALVRPK